MFLKVSAIFMSILTINAYSACSCSVTDSGSHLGSCSDQAVGGLFNNKDFDTAYRAVSNAPRDAGQYIGIYNTREEFLSAVKSYDGVDSDLTQLDFQIYFIQEILNKPEDKILGNLTNAEFARGLRLLCNTIETSVKNDSYKVDFPNVSKDFNKKSGSIKNLFKNGSDLFMCNEKNSVDGRSVGHIWPETKKVRSESLFDRLFTKNGMDTWDLDERWTQSTRWIKEREIDDEIKKHKASKGLALR